MSKKCVSRWDAFLYISVTISCEKCSIRQINKMFWPFLRIMSKIQIPRILGTGKQTADFPVRQKRAVNIWTRPCGPERAWLQLNKAVRYILYAWSGLASRRLIPPCFSNREQRNTELQNNGNLYPKKLSAVGSFYGTILNPRKRLKTLGFKQANNLFPLVGSHTLLRASRELARKKSREDIGFWSVKDMASMGCRDVTRQQTCPLYQP